MTKIDDEKKINDNKPNLLKNILSTKDNKDNKTAVETKKSNENVFTPFSDFQTQTPSKLKDIFSHPNNTSKKVAQIPKKRSKGGLTSTSNKEKYYDMFPQL